MNAKRLFDYVKYMVEDCKVFNYMSLPIQIQELYSSVSGYFKQVEQIENQLYGRESDYSDAVSDFFVLHPVANVRQIVYGSKDTIEKGKDPIYFALGVVEGSNNCCEMTILTEDELFYLLCILFKYSKEVLPTDCAANAESLTFGYEHLDDYSEILLETSLQPMLRHVTEINSRSSNVKFTLDNPNVLALSIVASSYGLLKSIFIDLFNMVPYEDGGILLLLRQQYLDTNKKTIASMIIKNICSYFTCSFENGHILNDERIYNGDYAVFYDVWIACYNVYSDSALPFTDLNELLTALNATSFVPVTIKQGTNTHCIANFFYKSQIVWDDESILNDLLVLPVCPLTRLIGNDKRTYLIEDGEYYKSDYPNHFVEGDFQFLLVAKTASGSWFGSGGGNYLVYNLQNVKVSLEAFEAIITGQEVDVMDLNQVNSAIEEKISEFSDSQTFTNKVTSIVQSQSSIDTDVQSLADRLTNVEDSLASILESFPDSSDSSENDNVIQSDIGVKIADILSDLRKLKEKVYTKSEVNKIVLSSTIIAKAAL